MGNDLSDRHPSPLRYPGGKSCIFSFVSKLIIENDLIGINYAEPYAGGAGLALRLLAEEYVGTIQINDLDPRISTFWKVAVNRGEELCSWLESVPVNVQEWIHHKQVLTSLPGQDELAIAKALLFLNRTNVSGVIKGGIIGGLQQNGKYKIDARFNRSELIKKLERINKFRHRIKVSSLDGVEFLNTIERSQQHVFFYIDPPYVQKGADLYMNSYSKADHMVLADKVRNLQKLWLMSYDNHPLIHELYIEFERVNYALSQSASNRVGDEILIFSPPLVHSQSISNLKNAVYLSA